MSAPFPSFDSMLERWVPYMPQRFRHDRMPYLFCMVSMLILALILVSMVTPFIHGVPAALMFAVYLLLLMVAFSLGLPQAWAVHIGVAGGVALVAFVAWVSGGIFSPRLAWCTAIPLLAFYGISRRAGLFWMLVVLGGELVVGATNGEEGTIDFMAEVSKKLIQLQEFGNIYEKMMEDIILSINYSRDMAQKGGLLGYNTGFNELNNTLCGWVKPDLVIVAARPGMGQTAFMLSSI